MSAVVDDKTNDNREYNNEYFLQGIEKNHKKSEALRLSENISHDDYFRSLTSY